MNGTTYGSTQQNGHWETRNGQTVWVTGGQGSGYSGSADVTGGNGGSAWQGQASGGSAGTGTYSGGQSFTSSGTQQQYQQQGGGSYVSGQRQFTRPPGPGGLRSV